MSDEFKTPTLDYLSRDYKALRDDALARIPFFTEEWTDHSPTDPGVVLLQLFAGMLDINNFYLDQKFKEALITTVRGRKSLIQLAALVGGRPKGKAPATALLDFTLQSVQVNPTLIPVGSQVVTVGINPSVVFEVTESVTIPAGALTVTGVQAIAGQTQSGSLGTSTGQAYQEFLVEDTAEVLDEGITIAVNLTPWTYVPALGQAGPDETVWSFRRDEAGRVYIQFGNGTVNGGNGLIPSVGATINATWRTGGGRRTSVPAGSIRSVLSTILSGGNPVSISCNNPKAAEGGDEEELVTVARRRIPRAYRANDRIVITQDAEALAESIPGVLQAYARVSGINQWTLHVLPHPSVGVGTGVDPFGYAVLPTKDLSDAALAELVRTRLAAKVIQTDTLLAQVVSFRPVDISTTIYLVPGANRTEANLRFSQFVADFFDVGRRAGEGQIIGTDFSRRGDLHVANWDAGVDALFGVDYPDTTIFQLRPQVERVAAVGNPVFTSIQYTPLTTDAIWDIYFLDAVTYRVYRQDISGGVKVPQAALGSIGLTFTDDKGEVEFVITSTPGNEPFSGDRWRFRSSPQRGSVRMLRGEVAVQGVVNFTIVGGA